MLTYNQYIVADIKTQREASSVAGDNQNWPVAWQLVATMCDTYNAYYASLKSGEEVR